MINLTLLTVALAVALVFTAYSLRDLDKADWSALSLAMGFERPAPKHLLVTGQVLVPHDMQRKLLASNQ